MNIINRAASAASGYQASQAAYGVSSAPGVTATSSYSAPRNAGYDTSAYQAATSASYGGKYFCNF